MSLQVDDYEIVAFFALVLVFEFGERIWPARKIDRLTDVKLDVLSFAFALTVNRVCNYFFRAAAVSITPPHLAMVVAALQSLPSALKILIALFVVDFVIYWIHRAQHHYDFFWRTHAWHHSIEQMYWFSGFRTSFLHSFLYNIPQVVIPVTIFKLSPAAAGIGYSLGLFIQFVEHTNWKLSFGPLNWLLVTPDYHRIHHSATVHRGRNLGTTFRLWDRMFGTYVDPAEMPEEYPLGLGERVEGKKIPRMLVGV
ncbi:MAG TPA: sterol desaturase family protein [Candidatus Sulfopaludibacter sp.]|nr:sterol desaturase family protein [Candidatus Sulfopaludibacter sp.]